jgi:hypothetical protein
MSFEKLIKDLAAPKETGKYASMSFADMDRIAPYIAKVAAGELEGFVGSPQEPDFPEAAKGTENAGRPATASELRVQNTIPTDSGSRVVTDKVAGAVDKIKSMFEGAKNLESRISTATGAAFRGKAKQGLPQSLREADAAASKSLGRKVIGGTAAGTATVAAGATALGVHAHKKKKKQRRELEEALAGIKSSNFDPDQEKVAVTEAWVRGMAINGFRKRVQKMHEAGKSMPEIERAASDMINRTVKENPTKKRTHLMLALSGERHTLHSHETARQTEKALRKSHQDTIDGVAKAHDGMSKKIRNRNMALGATAALGVGGTVGGTLGAYAGGKRKGRKQEAAKHKHANFDPDFTPGSSADALPEYAALPAHQKYRRQLGGGVGGAGGVVAGGMGGIELARRYGAGPLGQALSGIAGGTLGGLGGRAGGRALANMSLDPRAKQVLEAQGSADDAYAAQDNAANDINAAMSGLPAARDTRDRLIQRMRMMQAQGMEPKMAAGPTWMSENVAPYLGPPGGAYTGFRRGQEAGAPMAGTLAGATGSGIGSTLGATAGGTLGVGGAAAGAYLNRKAIADTLMGGLDAVSEVAGPSFTGVNSAAEGLSNLAANSHSLQQLGNIAKNTAKRHPLVLGALLASAPLAVAGGLYGSRKGTDIATRGLRRPPSDPMALPQEMQAPAQVPQEM